MNKKEARLKRALRSRSKIKKLEMPRLSVHKTLQHVYAQIIDVNGRILACASTVEKGIREKIMELYPQRVDFIRGVKERAAGLNRQDCRFEWRALCASPKGECTGSTRVMYDRYMRTASDEDNKVENSIAKGIKRVELAAIVGQQIAERAKHSNISRVAFDRSGFKYHGVIKALADAAREAGLEF